MRYLMLGFLFATSVSCATLGGNDYRQEISGLTDMSIEYIEELWGKPDYDLPKTTGRSVKYNKILFKDEDPVTEVVVEKLCTVNLDLDKEGLVQDYSEDNCQVLGQNKPKNSPGKSSVDDEFDIDDGKLPDLPMAPGE